MLQISDVNYKKEVLNGCEDRDSANKRFLMVVMYGYVVKCHTEK